MQHIFDALITHTDEAWEVTFPQLPEAVTFGETREEAIANAADALKLVLCARYDANTYIPDYKRDKELVTISTEVTEQDIEVSKCFTREQACEVLNVTSGRLSQLISANKLQAVYFNGRQMITIASVNKRLAKNPKAGRPKK